MFVLAALMVFGCQAMAQVRGAMFLGPSFPMSDYGKFNGFNLYALNKADETEAGAGIGVNVGLKWYFNVGVEGLGLMLSVDGFYNGLNSDLKEAYRKSETSYDGELFDGSLKFNSTPKYINVPAMLGVNYIYHINPQFAVYAEAGAGGNLRFITEMESVEKGQFGIGNTVVYDRMTKTTQNYDHAFSFAYQAGIGVQVAKRFLIGCSFYDLGNAEVKGDLTSKVAINNGDPTTTTSYNTYGTVHPVMIVGRIGFSF